MTPLNPPDVIACGAPTNIALCADCIDAYRTGIEPGESECEAQQHETVPLFNPAPAVMPGQTGMEM